MKLLFVLFAFVQWLNAQNVSKKGNKPEPKDEDPVDIDPENIMVPSVVCNRMLTESFDIMGETIVTSDRNFMCPGVMENCCSLNTQLDIYKRWIVDGEKERIKSFYEEFPKTYDKIFSLFMDIETIAEEIRDATEGVRGSNCNRLASVIIENKVSAMRGQVVKAAKKASRFIYRSRKGIYCSLCDAENHSAYNNTDWTLTMSQGFCAKMVEQTMPFYLYRYQFFIKIARLYAEMMTVCSLRGEYMPTRMLRHNLKFFKHKDFENDMVICKGATQAPGAIASCQRFCKHFNPIRLSKDLDGELDTLASFAYYLKRRIRWLKLKEKKQKAADKEAERLEKQERLLSDAVIGTPKPVKRKERLDESVTELIKFNRDFGTTLLKPVSYQFDTDLSIKYNIQYDESIIKTGFEKLYDVVEFRARFAEKGADFNSYGQMFMSDRETALKIFETMHPEKPSEFDFDNFLRSK